MEKKYITIPYFDKYAMATDMEIIELETGEKLTDSSIVSICINLRWSWSISYRP